MIELDGVSKYFGEEAAVDGISLTIPDGSLCVLVGTSGCGKSTTLRMINRLIEHSAGEIRIDGHQIRRFNEETLRRRIGYAIQNTGLFPHWTVARNIGVVPRLLKWDKAAVDRRVEALMALLSLDIDEFADKYPHQLSGGQAQRVGVARALAADPEILLMDEPFGALDPITRSSLQAELLRIQSHIRKTIVFVTHDMDEALRLADHIVVMRAGRIIQQGAPADILSHPADDFVETLVGGRDRGLKRAALTRVGDMMDPAGDDAPAAAATVTPEDSMRLAVSLMLWHGVSRLAVVDEAGQRVGTLPLSRLVDEAG
ncbi:ABC transporter ATP-binding protein [Spiribacter insolitus]|uniref:ABC transporter ATP-binding protein n=1 Tax=Spiribacter insolitus TaxID=3122417 RepID=A0ABV3T4U7_9GAMM